MVVNFDQWRSVTKNPRSLLDNQPLRDLLKDAVDFESINRNIYSGDLDALIVTAASYEQKQSVSFFTTSNSVENWHKVGRSSRETEINVDHLMASVALPLIFPAVRIDGEYYGDGAMRQETPLSPAIRLGATNLLIISTESPKDEVVNSSKKITQIFLRLEDTFWMVYFLAAFILILSAWIESTKSSL